MPKDSLEQMSLHPLAIHKAQKYMKAQAPQLL